MRSDNMKSLINSTTAFALIFVVMFVQFLSIIPVEAISPQFTVTPEAVSSSALPKRITVTSSENSFTENNSTPYIMQNGSVVESAMISNVTSTTTEASFTLGAGLSNGTYAIRIVDPKGTYDVGSIVVGDPSIESISPLSVEKDYSLKNIVVTGTNTNFTSGKTTVEILDSQGDVMNYVDSITSIDSTTSLIFKIKTGLPSGTYSIRLSTDDEVVTAENAFVVRGTPLIDISSDNVPEGYSMTTITVTGTNTGFDESKTIVSVVGQSSIVGTVSVAGAENLNFSLNSGLDAGSYTVKVQTDNEVAQTSLIVNEPTARLKYQGSNLDIIPAGYTTAYNLVFEGENTIFSNGVTELSLFNGNPDSGGTNITSTYISNTNVDEDNQIISFQLSTGLDVGTYYVRAVTNSQTVQDTFEIVSPSISNIVFNSDVASGNTIPEGYEEITVDVTGEDTLFVQGITTVEIQGEVGQTETVTVNDSTHLSFKLKEGLNEGNYLIVVDIDGDNGTTSDQATYSFTVTSPSISNVSPNTIVNTDSTPVVISVIAENTHFTSGTPNVDITGYEGETTSNITAISDTMLTFKLTPSSIDTAGNYGLSITTTGSTINETVMGSNLITVASSGISSISPSSIFQDELGSVEITILGEDTNFVQGSTSIQVGDTLISGSSVSVVSTKQLCFTIPEGLSEGANNLTVTDADSNEYQSSILVDTRSISINPSQRNFQYSPFAITVTGHGLIFNTSDKKPSVSISGYGAVTIDNEDISSDSFTFAFPTGLASGTHTVTVAWSGIQLTDIFTVKNITSSIFFKQNDVRVTSISVDNTEEVISIEAWAELIAGGNVNVTSKADWSVTNGSDVVNVNDNGSIVLINPGDATISASYDGKSGNIDIEVTGEFIPVESLSITPENPDINVNGTVNLTVIATMGDASTRNVTSYATWESSNTIVATVDAGVVEGISAGTVTITAIYNGESDNVIVTVNEVSEGPTGGGGGIPPLNVNENVDLGDAQGVVEDKSFDDGTKGKKITLDEQKTIECIQSTDKNNFMIELDEETSNVDISISFDVMEAFKQKGEDTTITVKSTIAEYVLPADVIDIEEIKTSLDAEEVNIDIIVKEPAQGIINQINNIAAQQNMQLLAHPVEFKIEASSGDNKIEISSFKSRYIARKIILNKSIDTNKAVGVIFDQVNNRYVHVPTKFYIDEATGNMVAQLMKKGNSVYAVVQNEKTFEDMINHWAKDNVEILASKLVINGMTETQFVPDENITRAQFAALLVRALGLETTNSYNGQFSDIDGTGWYAAVVSAAAEEGLVAGYEDGTFRPDKTISRQEMAVMVTRALNVAEKEIYLDEGENDTLLNRFVDKQNISEWAEEAVATAVKEGIIKGKTVNTFVPNNNATRAEAATMLIRMMRAVNFIN